MRIWVDADACPGAIRDILLRAAERTATATTFVANKPLNLPPSRHVASLQVAAGFDIADHEIAQRVAADDLVITSDIPLAAQVIEKGAVALSPRGEFHTAATVKARLNMRDFMDTLRASGIHSGGPPPLSARDRQAFANQLDTYLTRMGKK